MAVRRRGLLGEIGSAVLVGARRPHGCNVEHQRQIEARRHDGAVRWHEWRQQLRGTSAEGKPYYSEELVPVHGTRAQGLKVLRQNAAIYFPHIWKHVMLQRGIQCHEARKDAVTATRRADYAAQVSPHSMQSL